LKERDINFFRPLWRRVLVTAVCAIWAALELWHGEQLWIMITLGLTAFSVWSFFITFDKGAMNAAEANVPPVEDKQRDDDVPPQA
jgi:hypothetical protein